MSIYGNDSNISTRVKVYEDGRSGSTLFVIDLVSWQHCCTPKIALTARIGSYHEYDVLSKAEYMELRGGPPAGDADGAFLGTSLVDSNPFLCIQFEKSRTRRLSLSAVPLLSCSRG